MSALFLSLVHELGHIFLLLLCNTRIIEININVFSVDIVKDESFYLPYTKEIVIIMAGPLFNMIFALIFGIIYNFSKLEILKILSVQSFLIGLVNFIPISSLDGGQIFSIFLRRFFDDFRTKQISFVVSVMFIIPMMTLGFYMFIKSGINISMIVLAIYLSSFLVMREQKS